MAQMNWTFLDYQHDKYEIGLYHGDQSGHVLLYCNEKVVTIDFNVLETKTYTFYIGEELAELTIEREEKRFSYALKQNTESLTPLNLARQQQDRRYVIYTIIFFLTLVVVIALVSYFLLNL